MRSTCTAQTSWWQRHWGSSRLAPDHGMLCARSPIIRKAARDVVRCCSSRSSCSCWPECASPGSMVRSGAYVLDSQPCTWPADASLQMAVSGSSRGARLYVPTWSPWELVFLESDWVQPLRVGRLPLFLPLPSWSLARGLPPGSYSSGRPWK